MTTHGQLGCTSGISDGTTSTTTNTTPVSTGLRHRRASTSMTIAARATHPTITARIAVETVIGAWSATIESLA